MPRQRLTPQQAAMVRAHYAARGASALAKELGVPLHLVKNLVYREGLRRDPAHSQRKTILPIEEDYLSQHYPHQPTAAVARAMGRSTIAVYRMAYKLGLAKSTEYLASASSGRMRKGDTRGAASRFRKGHATHNKGKRTPAHVYAKLQRTMFKPGQLPHNTKHDGYISVRRDKTGKQYLHIRVALGRHVQLHRYIWEQVHGPVPPGHVIIFKDGDQGNCTLQNLEMVTRAEVMRRNSIYNYPTEIRNVMRIIGRLNLELKKHHGKEQNAGPAGAPVPHPGNAAQRRTEARSGT